MKRRNEIQTQESILSNLKRQIEELNSQLETKQNYLQSLKEKL
jgi:hypothetical protein